MIYTIRIWYNCYFYCDCVHEHSPHHGQSATNYIKRNEPKLVDNDSMTEWQIKTRAMLVKSLLRLYYTSFKVLYNYKKYRFLYLELNKMNNWQRITRDIYIECTLLKVSMCIATHNMRTLWSLLFGLGHNANGMHYI